MERLLNRMNRCSHRVHIHKNYVQNGNDDNENYSMTSSHLVFNTIKCNWILLWENQVFNKKFILIRSTIKYGLQSHGNDIKILNFCMTYCYTYSWDGGDSGDGGGGGGDSDKGVP